MLKCLKLRLLFAFKLSDVVFIMSINVKMPIISQVRHDESSMTLPHGLHLAHTFSKGLTITCSAANVPVHDKTN